MSETIEPPSQEDLTHQQIDLIVRSGALGRPGHMTRLFNFLTRHMETSPPPGETDIAQKVFNRGADFTPGLDAVVRVNIHRLRKKLDDFYLRDGANEAYRLSIPRGEYRLSLNAAPIEQAGALPPPLLKRGSITLSRRSLIAGGIGLAAANLGAWGLTSAAQNRRPQSKLSFDTAPWRAAGEKALPLLIVVGDYYIFGDTDEDGNVLRLVREFFINSRDELYQHMMYNIELDYRYIDLELSYLPLSVAFAMKDLAPFISSRKGTQIITASNLTPQLLRDHDVLYLGYLSGLGSLHETVFRQSRFTLGTSPDELVDLQTSQRYHSEGNTIPRPRGLHRDYGYFTTFPGPTGGRILIVSGMRDVGLAGAAEALMQPGILSRLPNFSRHGAIEALFEIEGSSGVNLQAKLVTASQRNTSDLWTTATADSGRG